MNSEYDDILIDLQACNQRIAQLPKHLGSKIYKFNNKRDASANLNQLATESLTAPDEHNYVYRSVAIEIASRWVSNHDLPIHERLAVIAQSVSLTPEIESLAENFIACNIELLNAVLLSTEVDFTVSESVLLAFYRLLYHDKNRFNKYINTELISKIVVINESNFSSISKLLAAKILSYTLNMSEQAVLDLQAKLIENGNEKSLIGTFDNESNINYMFLELNEATRFSSFNSLLNVADDLDNQTNLMSIPSSVLSKNVVSLFGVLAVKIEDHNSPSKSIKKEHNTLVLTPTILKSVREISNYVSKNQPVLITGKAGCGKTFLINELHNKMSDSSLIKIHLGEQTDAKLLLGTYTSGSKPGTFVWKNGVLTTAVKEGKWVLIEDINKAPTEVVSVLLTLLENRELVIPSRGEVIKCANGFQIISTITTDDSMNSKNHHDMIGMRLWNEVALEQIEDLSMILNVKFPHIQSMIPKFIECFNKVEEIYKNPQFVSLNRGSHPRMISVRDIMKLCARVDEHFTNSNTQLVDHLIENSLYDSIFLECVDCFTSSISEARALEPLVSIIGEVLEIAPSKIRILMSTQYVPDFDVSKELIKIGRSNLERNTLNIQKKSVNESVFATTNHAKRLMEQIGMSVEMSEPVLLVGETGTGKTTVVQQIASLMNKKLTVINVSQQTEMGDLLGGYKPVNCRTLAIPLIEEFEELFSVSFSMKKNEKFYKILHKCISRQQWSNVVKLFNEAFKMAKKVFTVDEADEKKDDGDNKKRKLNTNEKNLLFGKWSDFHEKIKVFAAQSKSIDNSFVFDFVEGSLVKAVKNGEWLLLDEINLASPDTLESIADLLAEPQDRSILLSEKGEAESISAHPDFRIFACMNPATDVGKRDLPNGIRSRFSEIYVHSPDRDIQDLLSIIDKYVGRYCLSDEWAGNDIAELYLEAKKLSDDNKIVDGSNQKPHFSIRTLTRTLIYVVDIVKIYGIRRSLYEGFCMSFLTLLDLKSEKTLRPVIEKHTIGRLKNQKSVISQIPHSPGPDYVQFKHYWMRRGPDAIQEQPHYIITPFVEKNMLNLVRATSGRRFPVLVQGPTSSGKTSMIKYLADITGHTFVRINNHEHTDLQEYLGSYVTDDSGKLVFKEGVLVEALRNGHWIVLDELNLAPTDVLEALNRLLDDNRELFIPETQEVVHPHPDFMLFATQNPPGIYGGRKILSRAFRNRFLELHFDDIPQDELEIIIRERCKIAPSYAKKIVECYRQLIVQRSANRLFEQKNSFATLRDLFRWANREAVGYEELAANGYMLLAERCRTLEEKAVVKAVLEKVLRVQLDMDSVYKSLEDEALMEMPSSVVWTKAAKRLATLVSTCLRNNEPVLLVGETGCGKTTICQLIASYLNKDLISINAHQNTETGDILGAQRPVRNRSQLQTDLCATLKTALGGDCDALDLESLLQQYDSTPKETISGDLHDSIKTQRNGLNVLFEWCDGPLIQALKTGNFFLLDEISLADDSVLERLNSVLEPERSLLLAEKGSDDIFVTAKEGFQFFATMNPGGDYGKKELSPALRNRFTEIWVPSMEDFEDVHQIVESKLANDVKPLSKAIVDFSQWYATHFGSGNASSGVISLRDILAWVEFINSTFMKIGIANASLVHGAAMVFIDALGTNNTSYLTENPQKLNAQKSECVNKLSALCYDDLTAYLDTRFKVARKGDSLNCGLFDVAVDLEAAKEPSFNMDAPTTSSNLMKVMRAMQVHKPILLEGSPGVGKTSLVSALAEATGNVLTRINLSEQTDLVDLFGSDAPGEKTGEFVWRDAPFLRAMQKGEWVLLDEMNLASQSVLEGLNACLDHRGEAYIPELDKSFKKHPNFLVFAAQNPQNQGGGRKGLPKSFINRFSVVYVDILTAEDLLLIAEHVYPGIDSDICKKMIEMMSTLEDQVSVKRLWGSSGSPWEFNLRDTLRWLKLLNTESICSDIKPHDFLNIVVKQRFRTQDDRDKVDALIDTIFGSSRDRDSLFRVNPKYIQANGEIIQRKQNIQHKSGHHLVPLQCNYEVYESVVRCINYNWPLILVGPTASGKSEIIKFVSSIIGTKVFEFSMNNDVDSMDILGGYEQVDLTRKISYIVNDLRGLLEELLVINISINEASANDVYVAAQLFDFISNVAIDRSNFTVFKKLFDDFFSLVSENNGAMQAIKKGVDLLTPLMAEEQAVKFEWFDGMLVKAVEEGHWLILDNANLCSPSVLDRLNSLLETNGSLIINECSLEDGRPRVVKPHPNFRLFLTVDPKYGELSRAMRNRGVEIYIDQIEKRSTVFDRISLNHNDEVKALSQYIPSHCSFAQDFAKIHDMIALSENSNPDFVLNTISGFVAGMQPLWEQNVVNYSKFKNRDAIDRVSSLIESLNKYDAINILASVFQTIEEVPSFTCSDKTFFEARFEYLNPIINNYFISSLRDKHPFLDSPEAVYLFKVFSMVYDMSEIMKNVANKGRNGRIDSMSYLEQSAATEFGRKLKAPPKVAIYAILESLKEFVQNFLHMQSKEANYLITFEDAYKNISDFLIIWLGAYETSRSRNEAKLRVYQQLMSEWIEKAPEYFGKENLQKIKELCDRSLNLTRGSSMSLFWNEYRGIYPSTKTGWETIVSIRDLSSRLDKEADKQFKESYSFIEDLREVFYNVNQKVLDGSLEEVNVVLEKIETGLEKLHDISDKFLIKRNHFFKSEYRNLMRMLFSKKKETQRIITEISTNSQISTELLIKRDANMFSYPEVFDLLWENKSGKYVSHADNVFYSNLFVQSVIKSNEMKTSQGFQINQTLDDAKLLLKSVVVGSTEIIQNKVEVYNNLLNNWILKICLLHTANTVTLKDLDVLEPESLFEDKLFLKIFKLYFANILASTSTNLKDIAKNWVCFGVACLSLYVPDCSFDPAISDYVIFDNFTQHKEFYELLVAEWANIRTVISGDTKILGEEKIVEVSSEDAPKKPRVYRPASSIDPLCDEWNAFMDSSVDPEQINYLIEATNSRSEIRDENLADKLEMFEQNTSQFLARLSSQYTIYADMNEILAGFVYAIKFGLDISKQQLEESEKLVETSSSWPIDILNISIKENIVEGFAIFTEYFKSQTCENIEIEVILSFFMEIFNVQGCPVDLLDMYNETLQTLYYRWSLRRMKEEEKAAQDGGSYRYNYDMEAQADEEFRMMFPDYDDMMSVDDVPSVNRSKVSAEDAYYEIAKTFMNTFNDKKSDIYNLLDKGSEVSALIETSKDFEAAQVNDSTLLTVVHKMSKEIASFKSQNSISDIDFYHDYSLVESKKSMQAVENLLDSVTKHLLEWPEHATLNEILRICHEFLNYPIDTAIARLLQKIEQIYTFVSDWEKYASSQVSLSKHSLALTNIIVSWRKLELLTWNGLFNAEDEKMEKSIGKWWFYLFESVVVAYISSKEDDFQESLTKLLGSLNLYFSKSTYGEYASRLSLIKAFLNNIKMNKNIDTYVEHALANSLSFYEQFLPSIQEQIAMSRKNLEKDMKEIILLASWKDVNVDALKQSSRRSHNNLYKLVRKYRDVLSKPVSQLIEGGLQSSEKSGHALFNTATPTFRYDGVFEASKKLVLEIPGWDDRTSPLKNVDLVNRNLTVYINRVNADVFPNFFDYVLDVKREADRLRADTPTVFKKEQKKELAALKVLKRKLLSDSIKELRRMGLKTNFREDIHKAQGTVTSILANSRSFTGTEYEFCDSYYFKILDLLPRMRNAVSMPNDEVPAADITKSTAIAENLIFSLIATRGPLSKLSESFQKFDGLRTALEQVVCNDELGELQNATLKGEMEGFKYISEWLPNLIEFALSVITNSCAISGITFDSRKINAFNNQVKAFSAYISDGVLTDIDLAHIDAMNSVLDNLVTYLEGVSGELSFACSTLISWINSVRITYRSQHFSPVTLQTVDQAFRKVYTTVMLSVQKINEINASPIVEEDDKWLALSNQRIMSYVKNLFAGKITQYVSQCVDIIRSTNFTPAETKYVRAMMSYTMPIVNQYYKLLVSVLNISRNNYYNNCKSTFVLCSLLHSLAKDGFCSPELPSETTEDNNLHDGTGLGDGEGQQNNTEGVEEDEDLLEDASTKNPDQKNKEDEEEDEENKEDDAVEMENDFAGDLEDASDQEDKDEDDEDEDEDKEMDEAIDDLNEDDPNAIDDKMWNEEAPEDTKEKDSDKMPDQENSDDIQAGDDEEDQKDEEDDKTKKDDKNKDPQANEDDENMENQEEEGDEEKNENDDNASEEEEVGEQEDEVKNDDNEKLESNVPEVETMDLPEDINLDSDADDNENDSEDQNEELDEFEDNLDMDEGKPAQDEGADDLEDEDGEDEQDDENVDDQEGDDQDMNLDENNVSENEQGDGEQDDEEQNDSSDGEIEEKDEQSKGGEENAANEEDDNVEGLQGVNDQEELDINQDTTTQQDQGSKGAGADAVAIEEQQDIGAAGATQTQQEEKQSNEDQTNSSREEAKESLKQLGDVLKEFHRRHQDIQEQGTHDENENEQKSNERPDEFEHVDGENTETDTQALGSANKEDAQGIDEEKAIDDDEEDVSDLEKDMDNDDDEVKMEDVDMDADTANPEDVSEESKDTDPSAEAKGAFIGERKSADDSFENGLINSQLKNMSELDELDKLIEQVDLNTQNENSEPPRDLEQSSALWRKSEIETNELASGLSEQLRLILEPTLATKLKGDYKTGKRLNMKRIIPYIASQFRKDKIWLRRTKPSKRQYQIMIAVDNSKSMSESKSVDLAFQSICLVSKALTQLESGGLSIVRFGENTKEVHNFDQQFSSQSGSKVFQWFDFQDTKTDIKKLCAESIKIFDNARSSGNGNADLWQLEIILSDGVCEDHDTIERLVRRARENKIMLVFVIIDGINANESIMEMNQVKYVPDHLGNMQLKVEKYLDTFPFEFYVVVHDITELPEMLSIILRQYFSELASM